MTGDPIVTLHIPRSAAHAALLALRKLPIEQAEIPHGILAAAIAVAEERILLGAIEARMSQGAPAPEVPPGT